MQGTEKQPATLTTLEQPSSVPTSPLTAPLTDGELREACQTYVKDFCCYGSKFLREMNLIEIQNVCAFHNNCCNCNGTGRVAADDDCFSTRTTICIWCIGTGTKTKPHVDDFISNTQNLPKELILGVEGRELFSERANPRHNLRAVPYTKATYTWKNKKGEFYVYGLEKKVYFEDYPQTCCLCTCC
ncbi:hypothetical protein HNY73_022603 [Argiope bruennichi]|uniref:Uncharacterized protein n=1 Tax=Argiope bruennichi TaxID=94029 RepID=A0A8T0E166_ARGBR|nr:hypothetical protein HNY73_022603 [Argiope bruennichi]